MNKYNKTFTINQLLSVQAHIGNKTSRWNPLTKSFLFGSRHGIHFFDLKETVPFLKRVLFFTTKATANHQVILFVGDHPFVSALVEFLAIHSKQSSISNKWVGGTLTNWLKIRPYVQFLYNTNIEQIRKKFVLKTEKKIEQKIIQYLKMKSLLFGIERMPTIPNLVVLLENNSSTYPLLESLKLMIPIISVVSTGPKTPLGISYPIFGNDYIFNSLFFYGNLILQAIKNGILQKRLVFIKTSLTFILSLRKKKLDKKKLLKKFNIHLRARRSYKALALKRVLRKSTSLFLLKKKL